ncbi:uncharacterized protein LOC110184046 [Drosophila serrata]|uniref:uncharacterized protein LOC110184046 n=1 Tax=Drosophila serrata TaxID=7274 RepID=UPI000A1D3A3F|nr:uncharacterized protein LOC110184046 [Drosophila serrata]
MKALRMLLLVSIHLIALHGHVEFNNLRCVVRDKRFLTFEYCHLKSINRTYKYASLKSKIQQLPIDNCVTLFQVRLRENKRILYNFDLKVDGCKFMRERNNVLANWIYQTFGPYSNMNHTCPYNHDIVLDKLPVQHVNRLVQSVIPDGRYYMNSTWVVNSIPRAEIVLYFTKS